LFTVKVAVLRVFRMVHSPATIVAEQVPLDV
jgi:hypothetical protein